MYICKNFLTQKEHNRRVKLSLRRNFARAREAFAYRRHAACCRLSILDQLITVIKKRIKFYTPTIILLRLKTSNCIAQKKVSQTNLLSRYDSFPAWCKNYFLSPS